MSYLAEQQRRSLEIRRANIASMGAGVENDFEMLACFAVQAGQITESRAREILACSVSEFRETWRIHMVQP